MPTLYEQAPEQWERMKKSGFPCLAEMSKRFERYYEMDKALGVQNTVRKYANGGSSRPATERKAKAWLDANQIQSTNITAAPSGMLMVAPPPEKMDAVRRVLALLGCEVIDI